MCWISKEAPVWSEAKRDIPVFKVGRISNDYRHPVMPYFFSHCISGYREGETYNEFSVDRSKTHYDAIQDGCFAVYKGFHSYSPEHLCFTSNGVEKFEIGIGVYNTDKVCPYVSSYAYCHTFCAVIFCVIPKGSKYVINSNGEVVSDALRVEKILRKPFKLSVFYKLTDQSIKKVNKELIDFSKNY